MLFVTKVLLSIIASRKLDFRMYSLRVCKVDYPTFRKREKLEMILQLELFRVPFSMSHFFVLARTFHILFDHELW